MRISSIGIDLGKTTFHLIALDDHSKIVIKKKFSHKQLWPTRPNCNRRWWGLKLARERISLVHACAIKGMTYG